MRVKKSQINHLIKDSIYFYIFPPFLSTFMPVLLDYNQCTSHFGILSIVLSILACFHSPYFHNF